MGSKTGQTPSKCRVALQQCLAIVLRKEGCRSDPGDFWMYENGYLLFQGLITANSVCWWNTGLNSATKKLTFKGYISPGALVVTAEPCAIDIVRNAWSRRVLQPPPGCQIVTVEELATCSGTPIPQNQWTPLAEAVCAVVLRLSRQGRAASVHSIQEALLSAFPHVTPPSEATLYDTLAQLTSDRKLYHSSRGYFIVTPERRRSRSHSRNRRKSYLDNEDGDVDTGLDGGTTDTMDRIGGSGGSGSGGGCGAMTSISRSQRRRTMLMTTEEALTLVHGDMATIRDGDVTHQLVQTNLADVICGGNPSDKILYPRTSKHHRPAPSQSATSASVASSTQAQSAHLPSSQTQPSAPALAERRGSFRLWRSSSSRRLRRCASMRSLAAARNIGNSPASTPPDSSSNSDGSGSGKKESLLTRLFRKQRKPTFAGQFPPTEWFNSKAVHLHSIGTQTMPPPMSEESCSVIYSENCELRPSTLPRRRLHHNQRLQSCKTQRGSEVGNQRTARTLPVLPRTSATHHTPPLVNQSHCDNKSTSSQDHARHQHRLPPTTTTSTTCTGTGPAVITSSSSGPSSLESHRTVINRLSDFTLQVKTSNSTPMMNSTDGVLGGSRSLNNRQATIETTANGMNCVNVSSAGTKIFVQNSPVRSLITVENQAPVTSNPSSTQANGSSLRSVAVEDKQQVVKSSTPAANLVIINGVNGGGGSSGTDKINTTAASMTGTSNTRPRSLSKNSIHHEINNSRKMSPTTLIKNNLSKGHVHSISNLNNANSLQNIIDKQDALLGSEPNIYGGGGYNVVTKTCYGDDDIDLSEKKHRMDHSTPSLNDLNYNFTSLAAQKILKGVGLNSVDTLMELSMNNGGVDVNHLHNREAPIVRTDFGVF